MPGKILADFFHDTKFKLEPKDGKVFRNYLQAVLNGTREAIFLLDVEGNIFLHNDYARIVIQQFTCIDIAFFPNLIDAVPEFRKEAVRTALKDASEGKIAEYEVQYPDGKWLEVNFFPINMESETPAQICGTIKDISIRKRADLELRSSESRYHSLFESMMEGVIFQSFKKFDNSANASAAEILEQPLDVLRSQGLLSPHLQWVDRKHRPVSLEDIFSPYLHIKNSIRERVVGLKTKKGIKWLLMNGEPVKKPGIDDMAGVFSFIDFSNIVQYQEEHALLTQVMKEISNIVVITDDKEKISWANQSFTRLSGYSLEEAKGKKPGQLFRGPDKSRAESEKIREAIHKGQPVQGEILNYAKNGKPFWSNYSIHPVKDEDGSVTKFFSIQSDITELKRIQEEIHRQNLEHHQRIAEARFKAQEEKQTQIGQELHDNINQILAVSQLYTGMIANGQGNVIHNANLVGEYLRLAISEIRALSHQLVTPRICEKRLEELFQGLAASLKASTRVTLDIKPSNEKELSEEVKLTLYRITQEQLNNVSKHAAAKNVWIDLKMDDHNVVLSIRDDGRGFDPSEKRNGIGLDNIFTRAEAARGQARIISNPGAGTELYIEIPAA